MCGRFVQQLSSEEIAEFFGAEVAVANPGQRYNVAPSQMIMVLVDQGDRRVVTAQRWGFVPPWADSLQIGARMINARAETVAEKPAFRDAFRHRRCVIPADAYYEWQASTQGKVPHAIARPDHRPLALAGLWSAWEDRRTGERVFSCAIITTSANDTTRPIHDRMPVILSEEAIDLWLDPSVEDVGLLQSLLKPAANDLLQAFPVSRRVNSVQNDDSQLLLPLNG